MKNLKGRSAILDVRAADSTTKEYNVEIQRADKGAGAKRARHNSSLLDAHILRPSEDTDKMPDSYVIFITENDVMKGGQPIYPVERYITIGENKVLFGDGSHIVYVNGKYRGEDEIGKLMHDFSCTNPSDMNYEALVNHASFLRPKGGTMSKSNLASNIQTNTKEQRPPCLRQKIDKTTYLIEVHFNERSTHKRKELSGNR